MITFFFSFLLALSSATLLSREDADFGELFVRTQAMVLELVDDEIAAPDTPDSPQNSVEETASPHVSEASLKSPKKQRRRPRKKSPKASSFPEPALPESPEQVELDELENAMESVQARVETLVESLQANFRVSACEQIKDLMRRAETLRSKFEEKKSVFTEKKLNMKTINQWCRMFYQEYIHLTGFTCREMSVNLFSKLSELLALAETLIVEIGVVENKIYATASGDTSELVKLRVQVDHIGVLLKTHIQGFEQDQEEIVFLSELRSHLVLCKYVLEHLRFVLSGLRRPLEFWDDIMKQSREEYERIKTAPGRVSRTELFNLRFKLIFTCVSLRDADLESGSDIASAGLALANSLEDETGNFVPEELYATIEPLIASVKSQEETRADLEKASDIVIASLEITKTFNKLRLLAIYGLLSTGERQERFLRAFALAKRNMQLAGVVAKVKLARLLGAERKP